jgi:hypothetical protein
MADQVVDIGTQLMTVGAGLAGGAAGYFLSKKSLFWTGIGAFLGAVAVPPLVGLSANALAAMSTPKAIQLEPHVTKILRAQVGDEFTIDAPSGWGVPSANANIPGFLEVVSTDVNEESTTVKVVASGQGNIELSSGGEVAILSVEA